jgi:hypothetical protein
MRTIDEIDAEIEALKKEKSEAIKASRDADIAALKEKYAGKWVILYAHTSTMIPEASTRIPGKYTIIHVTDVADTVTWKHTFKVDLELVITEIDAENRSFAVHPHSAPVDYGVDQYGFDHGFAEVIPGYIVESLLHENELNLKGMLYDAEQFVHRIMEAGEG